MTNQDDIEKEVRESMKHENIPDDEIEAYIKQLRSSKTPKALKKGDDPFGALMSNLPQLMNQMMNREKRSKLILELTTPDLFKISEFMMKEGIGKAQIMEDP